MSVFSRIYNLVQFKKFKKLKKLIIFLEGLAHQLIFKNI